MTMVARMSFQWCHQCFFFGSRVWGSVTRTNYSKEPIMANGEWVNIAVSDNTEMRAYVAQPRTASRGPYPAIMVFMEAMGVNAQIRGVADRYAAELGMVAVAPDLFHRVKPGFESTVLDRAVIMPLIHALTTDAMVADVKATHQWLLTRPDVQKQQLVAMGFCLGGRAAYLANANLPLAAAISYYGGGIAPALLPQAENLHGPHCFFWGGIDQNIPPEQHRAVVDAARKAGKVFVDVEFSQANHGFFNEQVADRYHESAARQSWAIGSEFLRSALAAG